MGYNELGFLLLSAVALVVGLGVAGRDSRGFPVRLLLAAIALRIFGSTARYEVLFRYYGGLGDAVRYYHDGLELARLLWALHVSPLSADFWLAGQWWGTSFLIRCSGLALTVLGPTMRGEFLLFALVSFLGLYAVAQALVATQPDPAAHRRFAAWLWLWPSLWFWPSSIGKEALLMLAIGLVALGYAGRNGAMRWIPFLAGVGLAFAIRPHVAAVLALSALAAQWLGGWNQVTPRRVLEIAAALVLAIVALIGMRDQLGLADADLEGVREFVQYRTEQTLQGGSNIGGVPLGPHGVPLAFINVWMRPFPWDVHNATSAFAALELLVFWGVVIHRRRGVKLALKRWRQHRLLRFALPLLLVYTLMIGLTFGNLGIIARQRAPMFPFMLLILTAAPDRADSRARAVAAAGQERAA